jgi:hypothetical protein
MQNAMWLTASTKLTHKKVVVDGIPKLCRNCLALVLMSIGMQVFAYVTCECLPLRLRKPETSPLKLPRRHLLGRVHYREDQFVN